MRPIIKTIFMNQPVCFPVVWRDSATQWKRVIRETHRCFSFARCGGVIRWTVFPHLGHVSPGCGAIRRHSGNTLFKKRQCFSFARSGDVIRWTAFFAFGTCFPRVRCDSATQWKCNIQQTSVFLIRIQQPRIMRFGTCFNSVL